MPILKGKKSKKSKKNDRRKEEENESNAKFRVLGYVGYVVYRGYLVKWGCGAMLSVKLKILVQHHYSFKEIKCIARILLTTISYSSIYPINGLYDLIDLDLNEQLYPLPSNSTFGFFLNLNFNF